MHSGGAYRNSDDAPLAELADRQHTVVHVAQLYELGYSKYVVRRQVAKARWHYLHRAVLQVGHGRLSIHGRWMAAVLACGPDAVLSHGHAAALHNLRTTPSTAIDVTAPHRHRAAGVRVHTARTLHAEDTTVVDAIPVTTIARSLLDQAERLHPQRLRTLLETTLRQEVFDLGAINATIARNPGRHGIRPLRDAIALLSDVAPLTGSEMANRFLELVREHGLPEPLTEQYVEGELVDFWWPQQRLIVEVDGWEFHRSHQKFDDDRRKDAKHQAAGYRVLRYTWQRIEYEAAAVAAEVRAVLRLGLSSAAA